jgi:protein-tyrosine phosphatase
VRRAGFDVLVLAAREYQPRGRLFPGVRVLHAPLDDAQLTAVEVETYMAAAMATADHLRAGRRVLVTCFLGLNRSGIIAARALVLAYGVAPRAAIDMVRAARGPHALGNSDFVRRLLHPDPFTEVTYAG